MGTRIFADDEGLCKVRWAQYRVDWDDFYEEETSAYIDSIPDIAEDKKTQLKRMLDRFNGKEEHSINIDDGLANGGGYFSQPQKEEDAPLIGVGGLVNNLELSEVLAHELHHFIIWDRLRVKSSEKTQGANEARAIIARYKSQSPENSLRWIEYDENQAVKAQFKFSRAEVPIEFKIYPMSEGIRHGVISAEQSGQYTRAFVEEVDKALLRISKVKIDHKLKSLKAKNLEKELLALCERNPQACNTRQKLKQLLRTHLDVSEQDYSVSLEQDFKNLELVPSGKKYKISAFLQSRIELNLDQMALHALTRFQILENEVMAALQGKLRITADTEQ